MVHLIARALQTDVGELSASPHSDTLERIFLENSKRAVFGDVSEVIVEVKSRDSANANESAAAIALESQTRLVESVKHSRLKGSSLQGVAASSKGSAAASNPSDADEALAAALLSVALTEKGDLTDDLRKAYLPEEMARRDGADKEVDRRLDNMLIGKTILSIDEGVSHGQSDGNDELNLSDIDFVREGGGGSEVSAAETKRDTIVPMSELMKSFSFTSQPPPELRRQQEDRKELSYLSSSAGPGYGDDGGEEKEIDSLLREASAASSGADTTTGAIKKQQPAPASAGVPVMWASSALLSNAEFEALRPCMALRYPFELDEFQKQAVMRLERRECVFVAAHTSAGKTVVAEYAIAMARRHGSRAVYTSPIKALSNQKYRDFRKKFGDDVGLITGDISVNPEASCLIMTTEILRSMLYRGSDIIRDIEFVIFDEVHYVNDAERGVVWEEVIIMLPERINMIFLSATTPNTIEFCDWIGRTKRRKVYVTSTSKRPVPLQHYLLHDDQFYQMMHAESGFQPSGLQGAVKHQKDKLKPKQTGSANAMMKAQRQGEKAAIASQNAGRKVAPAANHKQSSAASTAASRGTAHGNIGSKDQWLSLVRVLRGGGRAAAGGSSGVNFDIGLTRHEVEKARRIAKSQMEKYERLPAEFRAQVSKREYENTHHRSTDDQADNLEELSLLPVVIFCFSKKKCEEIADFMSAQDFLAARDKKVVGAVLSQMRSRLSPSDGKLPQVLRIEEMAYRGVGVHTGGLLPILKEAVEVLFSRGLIKVLVATETFAMGVNMPAKCVVFNGVRKHDGKGFRDLLPGEYTQMSGRAGRRGLDKVGTVIVAMWGDLLGETQLKTLLTGTASKLSSRFRLTYGMMVNLLRGSDLSVEDMMKRSFSEFHTQRAISGLNVGEKVREGRAKVEALQARQAMLACDIPIESGIDVQECYQDMHGAQTHLAMLISQVRRSQQTRLSSVFPAGRVVWLLSPSLAARADEVVQGHPVIGCPAPAVVLTVPTVMKVDSEESLYAWFMLLAPDEASEDGGARRVELLPVSCVGVVTSHIVSVPSVRAALKPTTDMPRELHDAGKMGQAEAGCRRVLHSLRSSLETNRQPDTEGANGFLSSLNIATASGLSTFEGMELNFSHADACKRLDMTLPCVFFNADLRAHFVVAAAIGEMHRNLDSLQHYASSRSLGLFPDFGNRLHVLKIMGYVDPSTDTVLLKGRVACEINTCNELLVTEMIFNNVLEPLTPPEAAALLSALVFQEKNAEDRELTSRLEVAREASVGILSDLNGLQDAEGVEVDEETKPTLNFGLAAAVYLWATGAPFGEITGMTLTQEGSIVRCITRLDELLNDCRNAARVIGNASLFRKMDAASLIIRRDIVFATSMYL